MPSKNLLTVDESIDTNISCTCHNCIFFVYLSCPSRGVRQRRTRRNMVDLVAFGDRAGLRMEFVYILISLKDKRFYTGLTNNVEKRILQHNNGVVRSTKSRRPFVLIHTESFATRKEAAAREKFLKSGVGRSQLIQLLQQYAGVAELVDALDSKSSFP
jgi:putative endonuclease